MDTDEHATNARFWERCQQPMRDAMAQGPDLVIALAEGLLAEWGVDGEQLRQVLAHGVARGELAQAVLPGWEQRLCQRRGAASAALQIYAPEKSLAGAPPHAALNETAVLPSAAPKAGELPPLLIPFARAIGECTRKKGHLALQMGRQLCSAYEACQQSGCSFPAFLVHLQKQHGLHIKTSYLYMQYCKWDFPDGLSSGVMKWIVGGFDQGSAAADLVIRSAMHSALPLAELKARHGALRSGQRLAKPDKQNQQAADAELPQLIQQVEKERVQLLTKRNDIDVRLARVQARLQDLRARLATDAPVSI